MNENEDSLEPAVAQNLPQRNFERRVQENDPARKVKRFLWGLAAIGCTVGLFLLTLVDGPVADIARLLWLLVVVGGCLTIYFLPAMVAHSRKHRNKLAIVILNIFLGWTFVGWVIALVWSCTANTQSATNASSP